MSIVRKAMTAEEARKALMEVPERLRNTRPVADDDKVEPQEEEIQIPLHKELRVADKLYGEAVNYARGFMDNVRNGEAFDFNDAAPMVDEFIDSVFRNDSAMAAISKLKAFDEYTYTHCINVSILAVVLGKRIGYSKDQLKLIGMAGMFHDVGKAVIPNTILNKPGKLSDEEMNVMRTHPIHGFNILKEQPGIPEEVLRGALEHHEKYDGSGYPRGLKGDQINEVARLLAVVDVYDALTSKRVYKDPMPPGKVLAMMYKWRVTDFHPNIVEQFIKSLGVYPVGSFVRLSNNHHGVVLENLPQNPLNPPVRVVYDSDMRQLPIQTRYLEDEKELRITDVINPDDHGIDVYRLIQ